MSESSSRKGRAIGLDVGTKTIGVAISDPMGWFAQPVLTLSRRGVKKDVAALAPMCRDREVATIIVGLPLELDGTEARSARLARQVGDALAAEMELPVVYVDERYSSVEAERRLIENRVPGAKTVWQLNGAGSVGGQVLTGIPRVWQLRTDPRLAFTTQIWPFETGLDDQPEARLILAEAYPSIVPPLALDGLPKDAGQVCALAEHLAGEDCAGRLGDLMRGGEISAESRRIIETEEAWILGITEETAA